VLPMDNEGSAELDVPAEPVPVFQVDADRDPRELGIDVVFPLSGPGSPPDLRVRATPDLAPVR
jgi:hypothetical protein